MTKQEMVEFLLEERDDNRREAENCFAAGLELADEYELAAQKFHAIICYLEGRANV